MIHLAALMKHFLPLLGYSHTLYISPAISGNHHSSSRGHTAFAGKEGMYVFGEGAASALNMVCSAQPWILDNVTILLPSSLLLAAAQEV